MKVKDYVSKLLNILLNGFNAAMKAIAPGFVFLSWSMILYVIYIYFIDFFPNALDLNWKQRYFHLILAFFFSYNLFFNYFMCIFTPSGTPTNESSRIEFLNFLKNRFQKLIEKLISFSPSWISSLLKLCLIDGSISAPIPQESRLNDEKFWNAEIIMGSKSLLRKQFVYTISPGVFYRYCHKCGAMKPPRTHHCSVSGCCVLEMDHFCPWTSNCVGYGNYRYFVLFLYHLMIGCLYVLWVMLQLIKRSNKESLKTFMVQYSKGNLANQYADDDGDDAQYYHVLYCFILLSAGFVTSAMLLLIHVYLIYTNQTTIEFWIHVVEGYDADDQEELKGTPVPPSSWVEACLVSCKQTKTAAKNPFDFGLIRNLYRVFRAEVADWEYISCKWNNAKSTVLDKVFSVLWMLFTLAKIACFPRYQDGTSGFGDFIPVSLVSRWQNYFCRSEKLSSINSCLPISAGKNQESQEIPRFPAPDEYREDKYSEQFYCDVESAIQSIATAHQKSSQSEV